MTSRPRTRGWMVVVACVVVFAALYASVVSLYALANRTDAVAACPPIAELPTDQITVALTPQAVDAAGERITASLDVRSFGPLENADGALSAPVTVYLSNVQSSRTLTFTPGQLPSAQTVVLSASGDVENWPFDIYTARVAILAVADSPAVTSGTAERTAIPVNTCGSVHVPGWAFSGSETEATSELFSVNGVPADELVITAQRSVATVQFGIVVLAAMVVMPVIGLTVAILVLRGRRKAEATLMSWFAAMLFATIPLRNFLPGSPPIGSWVDYLVVLWVVVGLVAALVVYVVAWLRWAPSGDGTPRR